MNISKFVKKRSKSECCVCTVIATYHYSRGVEVLLEFAIKAHDEDDELVRKILVSAPLNEIEVLIKDLTKASLSAAALEEKYRDT